VAKVNAFANATMNGIRAEVCEELWKGREAAKNVVSSRSFEVFFLPSEGK
jgi:hypothetical protein